MRDLLIAALVFGSAAYALRQPVFGILAFVGFGILNLHSFAWGFARDLPFALILAITTLTGYMFWPERKRFPRQREVLLLAVLWLLYFASTLFAFAPEEAWTKLEKVSKVLLMVFVSMILINTRQRLIALLRVISFCISFYAIVRGVWVVATGASDMVWGPERSFLAANNAIGLAMAMNAPLIWHLLALEKRPWVRAIMWFALACTIPAVIGTFSRGAWLGLAMAFLVIVWSTKRRGPVIAAGVLVALLAAPFAPMLVSERVESRYDDLVNYESESSAQSRLWSWRVATSVAVSNPLLGEGFNYYSIPIYHLYYPEFLVRWPGKVWSCHSAWFTVMSEHGFIAFAIFVTLIVGSLLTARRVRAAARGTRHEEWIAPAAHGIAGALLVYCVVATFYDAAYFDLMYQLVACMIILKQLAADRRLLKKRTRRFDFLQSPEADQAAPARPVSGAAGFSRRELTNRS